MHEFAGFTLLEILIALLIVSVGLLGVATLQIRGQQFNQVAYLRTQATLLAHDIMERMRINSNEPPGDILTPGDPDYKADDGSYEYPGGSNNFTNVGPGGTEIDNHCDENACSFAQLKDYDLNNWFNLVRETLPAGEANIAWKANNEEYTVTIRWKDIVDGSTDEFEEQTWTLQF